jgi:hypothetical protein
MSWKQLFQANQSPYFAMYTTGLMGVNDIELSDHLDYLHIPYRKKDWDNYHNGIAKRGINSTHGILHLQEPSEVKAPIEYDFSEFEHQDWWGTDRRWFPCNDEGIPLIKWGYAEDYTPELYTEAEAKALSHTGLVGQNLYMQPFIVLDIDGVGHGVCDEQVIEFGNKYRDLTEMWEDPNKPGAFHLYFVTDKIVPTMHFAHAKLDLLGNRCNQVCYKKAKVSNKQTRLEFNAKIWNDIQSYVQERK